MLKNITVSCSPHISKHMSTRSVMIDVVIAMVPAMVMAGIYFRIRAAILIGTCIVTALVTEALCNMIRKNPKPFESLGDFSAVVTAIVLALSVPPALPFWAAIIGTAFGIAIGKMVYGGLGANIFNPAMVGRAFLMASFGMLMTTWMVPATINAIDSKVSPGNQVKNATVTEDIKAEEAQYVNSRTQATPLGWSKEAIKGKSNVATANKQLGNAVIGDIPGSLGETSAIALLLGACWMFYRKTITIHIPLAVLLSAFVFSGIAYLVNPNAYMSPLVHLSTGGLLLCAFFIATDPVTAPLTVKGMWIFGIGVGTVTMLIRIVGEYPEGVMFAVLLMNAVTPLIDRLCKRVPAGGKPNG